ncbi:haloacid dehalogenase-like hydrolase [Candidatus Chloroploca sp. M-50]|uniref:Haloacid dehalogenase-like hydrolase n=1 Tax=Candidatus Chloroploca mongolica TaxID=2528176 RepID=A0ABS4DCS6_9CHLR|nr:HAD family hydrolase [Candidatus Chloroploca mongolica]MBP1467233.1 haloacid dehalogenase-like hydrolase [Candidatus Chloroploca mongolica]
MTTHNLASWNDTPTCQAILNFVDAVTDETSSCYVPPAERVAVFDNDGTLWCEKPLYAQLDLLLRKLVTQAEQDPALRARQPWQAAYHKDYAWLGGAITRYYQGDHTDVRLMLNGILALADGRDVEEVEAEAAAFVSHERNPTLGRTYAAVVYQPMLELLRFLESHGFTCYIVSGSGREFLRGIAEALYAIPRERVIGSTVAYAYEVRDGVGTIVQKAELDVVDDGPNKPIQIWGVVGRRPILAAGNSNGDLAMLQYAGDLALPALRLLLLHDDAEREFAYTAGAEHALEAAHTQGWTVISMRDDWRQVFPDVG